MHEREGHILQSVWSDVAAELVQLARAMAMNSTEAEDVVQEVFLVALRKAPPGVSRADLRRWLFRVTINQCNLAHRRQSRTRKLLRHFAGIWRDPVVCSDLDTLENDIAQEERGLIRQELAAMKHELRSVLVLRYYCDFNSREMGELLNLPDSTVRSQLRLGRQLLAEALKKRGVTR